MRSIMLIASFLAATTVFAAPGELLVPDVVAHAGLTPEEAVKAITLPPGFKATLFAGEPDVVQPIAFAIDDRGRLWVAEANNYPTKAPPGQGKDRILIFEDTTGAGHFDKRTVFMDGLNLVSAIEIGFGGVWVGQAPEMLFIPVLEGDKPGKPEILLDGFAFGDTHETLNSFSWGPDGWLYGCHGVFNQSKVGKPGTPNKDRIPMNAAVWRYHPTQKIFEIFAEGGSNQWGIDWNEQGQLFMTCCVIPHLYHVIQGGRYQRQAGQHFEPYTFDDIKTIADHVHWQTGAADPWAAIGKSDSTGGGHAHCGAMIYLGDNFPPEYRGRIFMGNIHGNRINTDILEPKGSGFVGHHGPDFMLMNDSWSRIISMKTGPDGAMYVIDWYDKQACHLTKPEMFDRTNGRIYRVTYGDVKPMKVDLATMGNDELVKLQLHANEWYVRHARRLLAEAALRPDDRGESTGIDVTTKHALLEIAEKHPEATKRLRAMLTLSATESCWIGKEWVETGVRIGRIYQTDSDPYVRAEALVQHLRIMAAFVTQVAALQGAALSDASPIVRLRAVQRLEYGREGGESIQWWKAMAGIAARAENATDDNIPLRLWYQIEPGIEHSPERAAEVARGAKIPLIREFIARRLALMSDQPAALAAAVSILSSGDDTAKVQVLKAMSDAFAGKRSVPMPPTWAAAYEKLQQSTNPEVKQRTQALAVIFGDKAALAALRKVLADTGAEVKQRESALDSLLGAKDPDILPVLQTLITDPKLRAGAIRGLAAYDDPKTAPLVINIYGSLDAPNKLAALNTLAARLSSSRELLAAIQSKKIPKSDLTAPTLRNLSSLHDPAIDEWIAANWGTIRATPADKLKEIARYQAMLKPEAVVKADAANGRAIFSRTCMQCHTLFDAGARIGPDLTGSNRANVDYLLEKIIDPSAAVGKDYALVSVKTTDGRFIDGIIKAQTDAAITVATVNEVITVPKNEIASQKASTLSMMPEGLIAGLTAAEVRDLIKYLGSVAQVPMK